MKHLWFGLVAGLAMLSACSGDDNALAPVKDKSAEVNAAITKEVASDEIASKIEQTLTAQSDKWNEGDIEGFMQDYWKSDQLRFASGGDVEKGWNTTLNRYQSRYPDVETMGKLTFSNLDISVISNSDALVFGRWELERADDKPWGLFTLHMRDISGRWVVVSDHTSSGGS